MTRKDKYRLIHTMLNELGIMHHKESILAGYGVESSKDLSDDELSEIIARLYKMKTQKQAVNDATRKLRSEILTLLQKLGVYNDNKDWGKVNEYMKSSKIAGKLMYECSDEELIALRKKLHVILEKHVEDVRKKKMLTILN